MESKDLKHISLSIPTNLNDIKPDIELIINKTENVIKQFLEKQIYTSTISDINKEKLDIIFIEKKKEILDKF
jgi:hypothetical protein